MGMRTKVAMKNLANFFFIENVCILSGAARCSLTRLFR